MATNKYFNQIRKHYEWNPEDNKEGYYIHFDNDGFSKVVQSYLKKEHGKDVTIEDTQKMPHVNSLLLMNGDIPFDDYKALLESELDERGKYPFAMDKGEEFVKACQNVLKVVYEHKPKANAEEIKVEELDLSKMGKGTLVAIDNLLQSNKFPEFSDIVEKFNEMQGSFSDVQGQVSEALATAEAKDKELEEMKTRLAQALEDMSNRPIEDLTVEAVGDIPEGKMVEKKASEVFGMEFRKDFTVPVWEWDGVHPDVPAVDERYIFRERELTRVLYAIVTNQRAYLQGHTGAGKTTLIEQVAAHLNWPFIRINFDSEITRMDLIGRDTLSTDEEGNTVSSFVDGILPKAMSSPAIACFDEIDFARPDVAYVMQAALEGNQLRITEDGDRIVRPHPMFRMFGTGNTVGQGDENGMYQGARPQSLAFLDRFTIWIKVGYLDSQQRADLVKRHYPALTGTDQQAINQYVTEHLEAFTSGKCIQPISPRGMLAVARATSMIGDVHEALTMTILDRANEDDYAVLQGIVDRVCKG